MEQKNIRHLENARSSKEADKWLMRHHDSYSKLEALLSARKFMPWQVFYKTLGCIWNESDSISKHKYVLYRIFANSTRYQLSLLMDKREKLALSKMPEIFSIYRGCYQNNRIGLSWTTDKDIAVGFTLQNRYQQAGKMRLLLESKIKRENAILLLSRNEFEVIALKKVGKIKTIELGIY